jgi:hypothetical protein
MYGPNRAARRFTAGDVDFAERNSTIIDPDTSINTKITKITNAMDRPT